MSLLDTFGYQGSANTLIDTPGFWPVGGLGGRAVWVALTQAEYDALNPPDPDTLYIVTD